MSMRSQQVADALFRAVLDHRLIPGAKLGERELGEIFDVSRIVVRQALIRLAEDGLVEVERNRGAFIASPGIREALEIYDSLTVIEQGVAVQALDRIGVAGWGELRSHVQRQRAAVAGGREALADDLGQDFHAVFVGLIRNSVILEAHAQLSRRATLFRSLVRAEFDYCNLIDEHEKLIDLLEKGRLKPALDLISSHNNNVVRGYVVDRPSREYMPLREALAPYAATAYTAKPPIATQE